MGRGVSPSRKDGAARYDRAASCYEAAAIDIGSISRCSALLGAAYPENAAARPAGPELRSGTDRRWRPLELTLVRASSRACS